MHLRLPTSPHWCNRFLVPSGELFWRENPLANICVPEKRRISPEVRLNILRSPEMESHPFVKAIEPLLICFCKWPTRPENPVGQARKHSLCGFNCCLNLLSSCCSNCSARRKSIPPALPAIPPPRL